MSKIVVVPVHPLRRFAEVTVPVAEWIARSEGSAIPSRLSELMEAVSAVSRAPHWEGFEGCDVRVSYNPGTDGPYFIFKAAEDGMAFVVGRETPLYPRNKDLPDPESMLFEV